MRENKKVYAKLFVDKSPSWCVYFTDQHRKLQFLGEKQNNALCSIPLVYVFLSEVFSFAHQIPYVCSTHANSVPERGTQPVDFFFSAAVIYGLIYRRSFKE